MFSEMVNELAHGRMPELAFLRRRFDMAITKKMGVLRLPAAFWMEDPKINPRADHLFWASLLLLDPERMELARAVLVAEQHERWGRTAPERRTDPERARELLGSLLDLIGDAGLRREFAQSLRGVAPAWLSVGDEYPAGEGKARQHGDR